MRLGALMLLATSGCAKQSLSRYFGAAPQKLMGTYSDLVRAQYTVIADFESAHHAKLFSIEGPGEPEAIKRDRKGAVPVTGASGLRVVLRSSADALVLDNRNEPPQPLVNDWSAYRLLLASVYSPLPGLELELAIRSEPGDSKSEAISILPLKKGWNPLRLDLSEAAPMVNLENVQSLRWRIASLPAPVELYLDDIILADNRVTFAGNPEGGGGALYVQQEGRHINVGSPGRFELSFGNGQIVRWFALDDDPQKQVNLVGSAGALGPIPVVLTDPDMDAETEIPQTPVGFSSLGQLVSARQRVIEANDIVVIMECTWAFPDSVQESIDDRTPFQRWTYAIYQTGDVYVTVECTTEHGDFKPEYLGMVVSRILTGDLVAGKHEPAGLGNEPMLQHLSFAWLSEPKSDTGLLWVIHDSRQYPQLRGLVDDQMQITSVAAYGGSVDYPTHRSASLMSVWPQGNCSQSNREAKAIYYCQKMDIEVAVGELQQATMGDQDGDGFNERLGAYMVQPSANQIQIKLDGRRQALVNPVFCVQGVGPRDASVYLDYAIHPHVARLSDGNLLIQIPQTITGESVLEVYLKNTPVN